VHKSGLHFIITTRAIDFLRRRETDSQGHERRRDGVVTLQCDVVARVARLDQCLPARSWALIWKSGDKSPTPTRCPRRGSTVITALRLQLPNNLQCVSFTRNLPCIRLHGEQNTPLHMSHPSPVSCRLINEVARCLERYGMVPVDVGFCDAPLRPYEHHPGVSFITYCVTIEK
jgi:hypothetical protein